MTWVAFSGWLTVVVLSIIASRQAGELDRSEQAVDRLYTDCHQWKETAERVQELLNEKHERAEELTDANRGLNRLVDALRDNIDDRDALLVKQANAIAAKVAELERLPKRGKDGRMHKR